MSNRFSFQQAVGIHDHQRMLVDGNTICILPAGAANVVLDAIESLSQGGGPDKRELQERNDRQKATIEDLRAQIEPLRLENAEWSRKAMALEAERRSLSTRVQTQEQSIIDLRKNSNAFVDVAGLERAAANATAWQAKHNDLMESSNKKILELEESLRLTKCDLHNARALLPEGIEKVAEERSDLRKCFTQSQVRISGLKAEIRDRDRHIEGLKQQIRAEQTRSELLEKALKGSDAVTGQIGNVQFALHIPEGQTIDYCKQAIISAMTEWTRLNPPAKAPLPTKTLVGKPLDSPRVPTAGEQIVGYSQLLRFEQRVFDRLNLPKPVVGSREISYQEILGKIDGMLREKSKGEERERVIRSLQGQVDRLKADADKKALTPYLRDAAGNFYGLGEVNALIASGQRYAEEAKRERALAERRLDSIKSLKADYDRMLVEKDEKIVATQRERDSIEARLIGLATHGAATASNTLAFIDCFETFTGRVRAAYENPDRAAMHQSIGQALVGLGPFGSGK